jgi:hypothetical protein
LLQLLQYGLEGGFQADHLQSPASIRVIPGTCPSNPVADNPPDQFLLILQGGDNVKRADAICLGCPGDVV